MSIRCALKSANLIQISQALLSRVVLSVFQLSFSMWFSGPSLSKDAMNRASSL